ncbi:hypothetical protein [Tessaracoccus caeni]|uniref:hypothetical protein n=1 Tax=Tessaracoccus caeni TaxID=3031239 RepID=UPI0023D9D23E|nr:hypothetical protein [Tessaracoccus caeni]MDF1489392.1 hypothetical protein [Tessaracoccus caeni]
MADPLYAAQEAIYRIAGRSLLDSEVQDGKLLNLLGVEMRRINPQVLADHARSSIVLLGQAVDSAPGEHVIVCDDARPPDFSFLCEFGFKLVRVDVFPEKAVDRRSRRGDISLGSLHDPNEIWPEQQQTFAEIDNNGSVDDLFRSVQAFWSSVLS